MSYTAKEFNNVGHLEYDDAVQEIERQREQNERLAQAQSESDAYINRLNSDDYWDHQNKL